MLNRSLLRWPRRRDGAPLAAPPDGPSAAPADAPPGGALPLDGPYSDAWAPLVTHDEAARALRFFARAGVGAVTIDAAPADGAPPECVAADGAVLPLDRAAALPHATASGAPCRCRYRAAPPDAAPRTCRPADAVWIDA